MPLPHLPTFVVSAPRRPGAYVLLGILAFTAGCKDDPNSIEKLANSLRECGLISEGKVQSADDFLDEDHCEVACISKEPCGTLESFFCDDGRLTNASDRLVACWKGCLEKHGFDCGDGTFVSQYYACDGESDCDDGSDEEGCSSQSFFCVSDGEAVPDRYRCDGEPDCEDESDEEGCHIPRFDCGDGTTVPAFYQCDFDEDCDNGSDEAGCAKDLCEEM